ncbi:MAG: ORF6N domain-containing protein [Bacteroidales bacterium]|nr:ORF6N domain-containing protein [Bacteroidales bacterium]
METIDNLKSLIFTVRGVKVMLDADLAEIYGYTTSAFNQQVKNNINKFDSDFRFQITKEEYHEILRSKILTSNADLINCISDSSNSRDRLISKNFTSNRGGTRKLPFVFTEQGIYMLMTILKGELATKQSKALIRTFKEMKDFIVDNSGLLIGNRELMKLAIQTSQNTADIAEIKETMVTKNELAKVIHDFTDPEIRREYLILNGETIEANLAYNNIYKTAKRSIFVIDNYIGIKTLVLLKDIGNNIAVTIFTDNIRRGLHLREYEDFCKQYPYINISFRHTCGIYHDRYIILDYDSDIEKIYHCGASSKDAGNKVTTISEVSDRQVYHPIVDTLMKNPTLILK